MLTKLALENLMTLYLQLSLVEHGPGQLLVYDLNFCLFDHPRTKLTRLGSFKQGQHCFLTKKMNQPLFQDSAASSSISNSQKIDQFRQDGAEKCVPPCGLPWPYPALKNGALLLFGTAKAEMLCNMCGRLSPNKHCNICDKTV